MMMMITIGDIDDDDNYDGDIDDDNFDVDIDDDGSDDDDKYKQFVLSELLRLLYQLDTHSRDR